MAASLLVDGRGHRRRGRARGALPRLAATARLAAGDRGGQHRRLGRGRPYRVHSLPARDGESGARAGLDRRPARAVSAAGAARPAFVPLAYVVLGVLYVVGNGKAYYLASLYPALLGLGALPTAEWTLGRDRDEVARGRDRRLRARQRAVIALPLLPERSLQGSFPMAVNPDLGETVGWPRFVDTVDACLAAIPAPERAHTAIFTRNYGEAGSGRHTRASHGLPRAYSGHNGFSEWGEPPPPTLSAIDRFRRPSGRGAAVRSPAARSRHQRRCRSEQPRAGAAVMLCRPTAPWATLWPTLRHYD